MRVLITAGPTREHWDAVRFLSSAATGRLGIELARAAVARGHEAVLVLGPTHLSAPADSGITTHAVVSALEMLVACEGAWPRCDALIATAAVADYRPAERHAGKRSKGAGDLTLTLTRNPDVLETLARSKRGRPVIGFALQVADAEALARRKMREKGCDAIVLDAPEAMAADAADFRVFVNGGGEMVLPLTTKADLAAELITLVETLAR